MIFVAVLEIQTISCAATSVSVHVFFSSLGHSQSAPQKHGSRVSQRQRYTEFGILSLAVYVLNFPLLRFYFSGSPIHQDCRFYCACLHLSAMWTSPSSGAKAMKMQFIFIASLSPPCMPASGPCQSLKLLFLSYNFR